MRVLFITLGKSDPATRFRVLGLVPGLEAAGVECTHVYGYGDAYNRVFARPVVGAAYKAAMRMRRALWALAARPHDVVVLQRTAFNTVVLPEQVLALQGRRLVLDVDDAIFLDPSGAPSATRARAFARAVRLSRHVIAGNRYLAAEATRLGRVDEERTSVIPTVVDTDACHPASGRAASDRVVIGWMGTAGHFEYFPTIVPAILRLLEDHPHVTFRMVSNARFAGFPSHDRIEQVRWSAADELRELQGFDVGIMPLPDDPWTRGKCGLKLIQYMAAGVPAVGSAVGANVDVLDEGRAGVLVPVGGDWYERLARLVARADLRRQLAEAGRRRAVAHFSTRAVLPRYLELFDRIRRE